MMVEIKKNTGRLPDFFIIGAAKSGTSSLFGYLCRHPEIFIPKIKEPEFFSEKTIFSRGEEWYKHLFIEAQRNQLCGDASTTYSRWPHTLDTPKLIAKSVPNAKFIYIMRHPVDRTYSHYAHHMRREITMTFEEAMEKDNIYIDCSMYMDQIERYLRFFPKNRFLFHFQKDLMNNPQKVLDSIIKFLGVSKFDLAKDGSIKRNVSGTDHYIRSMTTMKLRNLPGTKVIRRLIPKMIRDYVYYQIKQSFYGRRLEKQYQLIPMKPRTRKCLLNLFERQIRNLERFLYVDLSEWRI